MRIPRVYSTELPKHVGGPLALSSHEAGHLIRALRIKIGSEVEVFDGRGAAARFVVESVDRRSVGLRLLARSDGESGRELPFEVTCAVAFPKGKRIQRLVQTGDESGFVELMAAGRSYLAGRG